MCLYTRTPVQLYASFPSIRIVSCHVYMSSICLPVFSQLSPSTPSQFPFFLLSFISPPFLLSFSLIDVSLSLSLSLSFFLFFFLLFLPSFSLRSFSICLPPLFIALFILLLRFLYFFSLSLIINNCNLRLHSLQYRSQHDGPFACQRNIRRSGIDQDGRWGAGRSGCTHPIGVRWDACMLLG